MSNKNSQIQKLLLEGEGGDDNLFESGDLQGLQALGVMDFNFMMDDPPQNNTNTNRFSNTELSDTSFNDNDSQLQGSDLNSNPNLKSVAPNSEASFGLTGSYAKNKHKREGILNKSQDENEDEDQENEEAFIEMKDDEDIDDVEDSMDNTSINKEDDESSIKIPSESAKFSIPSQKINNKSKFIIPQHSISAELVISHPKTPSKIKPIDPKDHEGDLSSGRYLFKTEEGLKDLGIDLLCVRKATKERIFKLTDLYIPIDDDLRKMLMDYCMNIMKNTSQQKKQYKIKRERLKKLNLMSTPQTPQKKHKSEKTLQKDTPRELETINISNKINQAYLRQYQTNGQILVFGKRTQRNMYVRQMDRIIAKRKKLEEDTKAENEKIRQFEEQLDKLNNGKRILAQLKKQFNIQENMLSEITIGNWEEKVQARLDWYFSQLEEEKKGLTKRERIKREIKRQIAMTFINPAYLNDVPKIDYFSSLEQIKSQPKQKKPIESQTPQEDKQEMDYEQMGLVSPIKENVQNLFKSPMGSKCIKMSFLSPKLNSSFSLGDSYRSEPSNFLLNSNKKNQFQEMKSSEFLDFSLDEEKPKSELHVICWNSHRYKYSNRFKTPIMRNDISTTPEKNKKKKKHKNPQPKKVKDDNWKYWGEPSDCKSYYTLVREAFRKMKKDQSEVKFKIESSDLKDSDDCLKFHKRWFARNEAFEENSIENHGNYNMNIVNCTWVEDVINGLENQQNEAEKRCLSYEKDQKIKMKEKGPTFEFKKMKNIHPGMMLINYDRFYRNEEDNKFHPKDDQEDDYISFNKDQSMLIQKPRNISLLNSDSKAFQSPNAVEKGDEGFQKPSQNLSITSITNPNQSQKIVPEDSIQNTSNALLRVTKSKINILTHSKCAKIFHHNKLNWDSQSLEYFHRPSLPLMKPYLFKNMTNGWKAKLISEKQMEQLNMKRKMGDGREIITAHEILKNRFKLSLKDGRFALMENIDQYPLYLSNFGMASKLKQYYYPTPAKPNPDEILGPYGIQYPLESNMKIPIISDLDRTKYNGVTLLENNMYRVPSFYHKGNSQDFLLVIHKKKDYRMEFIVRPIYDVFVLGQEEPKDPKLEIFSPQSRQFNTITKKIVQFYVYKLIKDNRFTTFQMLFNYLIGDEPFSKAMLQDETKAQAIFSQFQEEVGDSYKLQRGKEGKWSNAFAYCGNINHQIFKKILKEMGVVEEDKNHLLKFVEDKDNKVMVSPENVCQFESAIFGLNKLHSIGVKSIVNAEKITYATNKFNSEEANIKAQYLARLIQEELLSTCWNLTQNFFLARETKGMMMVSGIGDPSNGNYGISYLKMPLKMSSNDITGKKSQQSQLDLQQFKYLQNVKSVTGTGADLRKLNKQELIRRLMEFGLKYSDISGLPRWQCVDLLRYKSSEAASLGLEGPFLKYARGVRMTTKLQKQLYHKQLKHVFTKQIEILGSKETGEYSDDEGSRGDDSSDDLDTTKFQDQSQIQELANELANFMEKEEQATQNQAMSFNFLNENEEKKEKERAMKAENKRENNDLEGIRNGNPENQEGNAFNWSDNPFSSTMPKSKKIEFDYEHKATSLHQLGGLLFDGEDTHQFQVLRKKIKKYDPHQDKWTIKTIYISDSRQIKNFLKRKQKREQLNLRQSKKHVNALKKGGMKPSFNSGWKSSRSKSVVKRNEDTRITLTTGNDSNHTISVATPENQHHSGHNLQSQNPSIPVSTTVKLNLSTIHEPSQHPKTLVSHPKEPKANSQFEYFEKKNFVSRKRQNLIDNQLNDMLEGIIDECIKFDTTKWFHFPVKKKDAFDYYYKIINPIDLTTMKNKAKRGEYTNRVQLLQDIELLRANAEKYNGLQNPIAAQARKIEIQCQNLVQEKSDALAYLEKIIRRKKEMEAEESKKKKRVPLYGP